MVNRLQQIEAGKSGPSVGDPMPLFVLPDETGRLIGLEQLLERGPVVMSFHRGHWCLYCRISADARARIEPEVRAAGAEILLITPEVQKFTSQLKSDARASFSILTDLDSGYALEPQLAIKVEDEKHLAMTHAGWIISAFQDDENWTLPISATFAVGNDGSVKARFVDPDYRKRMDVDDILGALRT
jgi:peroxiredoxin